MLTTGDPASLLSLPNLTGSCAHDAKLVGGFGLVWVIITDAYRIADLGRILPCETFTNRYHRGVGDSQLNSAYETQWLGGQGGVGYVGL